MNSIQVSQTRPASEDADRRRPRSSVKRQPRQNPNRAIAAETTAKLTVNLAISIVAISTLLQLLPSYKEQQQKLQEISHEVQRTEARVQRLRSEFSRNFDPQETQQIMQEQTELQDPQELQVIWKQNHHSIREAPQERIRRKPVNNLPTDKGATALAN